MYNCTNWVTKLWSSTEFWGCNFLLLLKQSIFEFRLSLTHCSRIPRGPVQQTLEDRIFTPAVSAVYSSVTQVARQPGPPTPSPYSAHEINKGHPNLAATPPGHASSPGLSQVRKTFSS